jgi:predicted small integral membrane protein
MKKSLIFVLSLIVFASGFSFVFAQSGGGGNLDTENPRSDLVVPNPSGLTSVQALLDKIINYLLVIMVPILTIMVLIGGFQMLTAQDNETNFKKGKKTVTYAAIGAAVVLSASGIMYVIKEFLGVQ